MKDVLIFEAGIQIFIIDGSRRTDSAARAVISALCENGRITPDTADRAKEDRKTLDDIKKSLIHCTMETRTTGGGDRWTFYTKSGVFMDIPSNSRNYIRADKDGNLCPVEAHRTDETTTEAESCTIEETSAQEGTESANATYMETFKKEYSRLFDESWEDIKDIAKAFCTITGDLLTSDRECAAFMKALETVGTPQASHEQTEPEETSISTTDSNGEAPQKTTTDRTECPRTN